MQTVSKSQFKAKALEYFRKIEQSKQSLIITHEGKPVAKVSPYIEAPEKILDSLRGAIITYDDDIMKPLNVSWEALK